METINIKDLRIRIESGQGEVHVGGLKETITLVDGNWRLSIIMIGTKKSGHRFILYFCPDYIPADDAMNLALDSGPLHRGRTVQSNTTIKMGTSVSNFQTDILKDDQIFVHCDIQRHGVDMVGVTMSRGNKGWKNGPKPIILNIEGHSTVLDIVGASTVKL